MARWFDSTSLDFSLLDISLQNQIASLATTTQDFYVKYIVQQKQDQLKLDLENVLSTTEEYAASLSASIFDYFLKYGANLLPQQPVQSEHLITGQELNSTPSFSSQPSPIPGQPLIDTISKAEVIDMIQQTNGQAIQAFADQMSEHKTATSQLIGSLKDDTKNELSEMRKEVTHITDILHRLADSFNQMRQFVEEYTRNNPVPNMQPQPQNPAALSYPAAPAYPASYASTSFPLPPPPPPAYPVMSPSGIGQTHVQQMQGGYARPYGNSPSNDLDMLKSTVFLTNSPDVVQVSNRVCNWLKRNEARVILDYIAIQECVACTWRIHYINKDSTLRIGFLPDMPTNDENALQSFSYELRNDGSLMYKKNREKTQPFSTGDSVRIELNLNLHHAYFFHNDRMLPFRIINIPQLCKFFIYGGGVGTCAEATNLLVIPAITDVPNRPQLRDLDGKKS